MLTVWSTHQYDRSIPNFVQRFTWNGSRRSGCGACLCKCGLPPVPPSAADCIRQRREYAQGEIDEIVGEILVLSFLLAKIKGLDRGVGHHLMQLQYDYSFTAIRVSRGRLKVPRNMQTIHECSNSPSSKTICATYFEFNSNARHRFIWCWFWTAHWNKTKYSMLTSIP